VRSGARPTVRRAERLSPLVCTVVCLRARLFRTARLENGFVDNVARVPGSSVSGQRFPLWPHSLPLHGAVFHPWCCCLPRVRSCFSTAWIVWVEMDWCRNNYWRGRSHLYSRTGSWSLSAKHDAVIRVYDEAGNVGRDAPTRGRFQRMVRIFLDLSGWDERIRKSKIQL
jgi:hypothetical protein